MATEIKRLVHTGKVRGYSDIAIMYRANSQAREVEQALVAASVPYVLISAKSLFERAEVRDVMAYLRLLHNNADHVALQVCVCVYGVKLLHNNADHVTVQVCVRVCMVCGRVCHHACICMYVSVYIYIYIYIYICIYHACICMYVSVYMHVCVCIYVCMYVR